MTKPNDPAFPRYETIPLPGGGAHVSIHGGMTLRQYYAGQMMAALLSNPATDLTAPRSTYAVAAVGLADALIAALNEGDGE